MTETTIQRLARVKESIRDAVRNAGRRPGSVQLLAISKTHPAEAIEDAFAGGQTLFGENYAQEFASKCAALEHLEELEFHFTGPLQSNKVKLVAGQVQLIHTVDRQKIVNFIARHAAGLGVTQDVLLEVHLSPEESKAGCSPEELPLLLQHALGTPNIRPVGLMTMPPYHLDAHETRPYFERLRRLLEENRQRFGLRDFGQLSMGMSHDFAEAIAEGATIVRVGTAIFGSRYHSP